jgi:tetratricopeptide (TPR) repeat protein
MQNEYDMNLQSYYTDAEHLREIFKQFVSAKNMPKRLMVIHGVGGVGKSSLLRIFRLHCKSEKIPVGLVSGDDIRSISGMLTYWMEDLKVDRIKFPKYSKTLSTYRAILAKIERHEGRNKISNIINKTASKTAETAGGALLGTAIGSVLPGVGTAIGGTLGGTVSGMSADAFADWLHGFLSKPDVELFIEPDRKLISDFLEDIALVAERKRLVLMLDTFDQMSAWNGWIGEIVQKIHPNILLVIAGRKLPDWNRIWPNWMINAQIEEFGPMTEDNMRKLIHRYYSTMRGGNPDPTQVKAIIKFARGLPMVVTSAVQLWVKYGVDDFQAVKVEIVANLVDRLTEGVPSTLLPALEAAATVRWFDQPILRAVMNKEDVRDVYNELRRFPFVRTRVEGLALHDSVRDMMNENLRTQDSEMYAELHERAKMYFEKKLEKATGEEKEKIRLERLYHCVCENEDMGSSLFQEMAEEFSNLWLINQLQTLLKDVNTYTLTRPNSKLWREYYNANLAFFERRYFEAEKIYEYIAKNQQVETNLKAYALCGWGTVLRKSELFGQLGGIQKAKDVIEQSVQFPMPDNKLITAYDNLQELYLRTGKWEQAISSIQQLLYSLQKTNDSLNMIRALTLAKGSYARIGDWRSSMEVTRKAVSLLKNKPQSLYLKINLLYEAPWSLIWGGKYKEVEMGLRECLDYVTQTGDTNRQATILATLAYVLGLQGNFHESQSTFAESLNISPTHPGTLGFQGAILTRMKNLDKAEYILKQSLSIKKNGMNTHGIMELHNWLGELYEIRGQSDLATNHYTETLKLHTIGRHNFTAGALLGLIRLNIASENCARIVKMSKQTLQILNKYEYNDYLAITDLILGHMTFQQRRLPNHENSFELTLLHYKNSLTYALKFNRFCLDEILSGNDVTSPLVPIIPFCLKNGKQGQEILIMLRDWWSSPCQNTLANTDFPSYEKAELFAREQEPGDNRPQILVSEQITSALSNLV